MNESFDDPQLKAALRRACGAQAAPSELRDRAEQILAGQSSLRLSDARVSSRRGVLFGLAAAAAVLLAVGYLGLHSLMAKPALRDDVASSIVLTHDTCCSHKDHHSIKGKTPDDFPAIGQILSVSLNVPVISTPVSGWQFAGAGKCPIWGHPSGHLLYRRGNQTLSIFTVPASDLAVKTGDRSFETTVNGHYLACFVKGNGLYCVLGYAPDGSVTAADARQVRDHLRDSFSSDSFVAASPSQAVPPRDVVALGN